ncbi:hypothetical protein [Jeotgalibacillus marinus]|uniref:Arginine repressor n=1 Tax=Jeotgalibacillus marinus TaxID=86667 RepID=A0ABV3Q1C4_9BACL
MSLFISSSLFTLIEENNFVNMDQLKDILEREHQLNLSQATLTRDFKYLGIEKREGVYKYVSRTKKQIHQNKATELVQDHVTSFDNDLSVHHIKVQDGKSSEIAHHLKQGYAAVVSHVQVDGDTLIIYLRKGKDAEELLNTLGQR